MNNNGRKIRSKTLLILIFTALFFSVTFNSPANYSAVGRFCKILTSSSRTALIGSPHSSPSNAPYRIPASSDTIPTGRPLVAHRVYVGRDTSYTDLYGDTIRYSYIRTRYGK